ncbi:MAG TPA: ABC transporter substrate-binding protein [Shinella sp.]|uniref:ABC transporter substrate-binding protein n=1 Tax=Shinella sp. TaxID=1870904 RepID=UPI002E1241AE|nr:ABC transporter substrate-binding protein [Shinella sp.]
MDLATLKGERIHREDEMRRILVALAAVLLSTTAFAQTLKVSPPRNIIDIDPHGPNALLRESVLVARQVFETLVRFDGDEPVGVLAESWKQIDNKTWEFKLRPGVKFHDGSAFDSTDIKASAERLSRAKGGLASQWKVLESVETPDPLTAIIRLKNPVGPFLRITSFLSIAPSEVIDAKGPEEYGAGVILPGTGPFKIGDFSPGDSLTVTTNPDYWGEKPKIDGLQFVNIPEQTARVTAILNGEVDIAWAFSDDEVSTLRSEPTVKVDIVPSATYGYTWFNAARKPFDDPRVRQAMWHAIDVEMVLRDLKPETGTPARNVIPETVFGFTPLQPYAYDPEKAKALLAEAGFPQGFQTSLLFGQNFFPGISDFGQIFVSYWDAIGVKVRPLEQERAIFTQNFREMNWDMVLSSNPALTLDADYTVGRLYYSENKEMNYTNLDLDKLLLAAKAESDQGKRKELYAEATKVIWDDAVGIFWGDLKIVYAARSNVSGLQFSPIEAPYLAGVTVD